MPLQLRASLHCMFSPQRNTGAICIHFMRDVTDTLWTHVNLPRNVVLDDQYFRRNERTHLHLRPLRRITVLYMYIYTVMRMLNSALSREIVKANKKIAYVSEHKLHLDMGIFLFRQKIMSFSLAGIFKIDVTA